MWYISNHLSKWNGACNCFIYNSLLIVFPWHLLINYKLNCNLNLPFNLIILFYTRNNYIQSNSSQYTQIFQRINIQFTLDAKRSIVCKATKQRNRYLNFPSSIPEDSRRKRKCTGWIALRIIYTTREKSSDRMQQTCLRAVWAPIRVDRLSLSPTPLSQLQSGSICSPVVTLDRRETWWKTRGALHKVRTINLDFEALICLACASRKRRWRRDWDRWIPLHGG